MKKEQYPQYFDELILEDLSDVGLFFDIDYFKNDIGKTNWNEITKLINTYASRSNEITNEISKLVME